MIGKDPTPMLRDWMRTRRHLRALFKSSSNNVGWERIGKLSDLTASDFAIEWDDGGADRFHHDVLTTIDGRQLRFLYSSGDALVLHEVNP